MASTTATLNGVVNPNKEDTTYVFQYGPTTAYGSTTAVQPAVSGNAGKDVSVDITGLAPSTVYHFRLVATNPSGTDTGADATFTTLASPYTLPGNGPGANTVTITVAPGLVTYGRTVVISGQVTGPKNVGVTVNLQQTPFPFTAPFKDAGVAAATTDATGKYSFTITPLAATRYQVVAKTSPPVTSAAVQVAVRYSVGLSVNHTRVHRGRSVRFYGSVKPAHDGLKARIQRKTKSGAYKTITTATLKHSTVAGRSTYSKRLRVYATRVYRVQVRADADHATGNSRTRRVRVS